MQTTEDDFLYDELQQALIWALAAEIRSGLTRARLPEALVASLTRHLSERIASVLDGRKPLHAEGSTALPAVAFLFGTDRPGTTKLLVAKGPAWMSQHVAGTVEALLLELAE